MNKTFIADGTGAFSGEFILGGATRYIIKWRCVTADGGTMTLTELGAAAEEAELAAISVKDSEGAAYSWDLSAVTNGQFEFVTSERTRLIFNLTGSAENEDVLVTIAPLRQ